MAQRERMENIDDAETVEVQLDLFGLDRIKLGEGYAALARLDLDKAASIFGKLLLENPDFMEAAEGKTMATMWGDVLREVESLEHKAAAWSLWERIQSYSFGLWGGDLRKSLIRRLIDIFGCNDDFYVPPNLSLGFLYAELADYKRAERAFRKLLEKHPRDARVLCQLGNSLFYQNRRFEARLFYTQAMLMAPAEVDPDSLEDREVRELVRENGALLAPAYGWLKAVMPLVACGDIRTDDPDHAKALMIYHAIVLAEAARSKRDHRKMIEQRRILMDIAPEIFGEYIARLEAGKGSMTRVTA